MRFERTLKGVEHRLECVKVEKNGATFRDGRGREFPTLNAAAKAATGWASCNGWYFWRLAGAINGKDEAGPPRRRAVVAGKQGATANGKRTTAKRTATAGETPSD